ncbi:hypothetical protein OIU74_012210 [Salix koriyanagi]|uniref:LysM domain receptor-like kinase 3 n=1 Tax=Salix koriyanagi TaxID=2511006 RepID=A0A9Q0T4A8_9ROSI|nr:hypothetical protein OIU74_012210 [Salix koriyanagi]
MNHPARTSLLIPENLTLPMIQSMFDVLPQDVTREGNGHGYVFIKKNCSCLSKDKVYVTNSTYTVKFSEGYVYDIVINAYDGLAFLPNTTRQAKVGAVVSLRLFCGCSSGLWNYFVSYVMKEGDTIQSLSSRFGVSMDSIETVNGIQNPDNVTVGALYYIPLNSVPGEPYPMENDQPPAPVPAPSHDILSANIPTIHKAHVPYGWIIGGFGIGLVLIVLCIIICVSLKSSSCFSESQGSHAEPPDAKISQKFHILRKQSFCCTSGRSICCKSVDWKQTNGESSSHQITIPKGLATDAFDEKPVVFTCEEILFATDEFLDSSLLGHGTYGSVYYGHLHDQEVAIKRMTATKTKEFTAEMKILCKVHHTNLVELIGYAAKVTLHDPQNKGHTPLSWIMRISDFGLAKLVGKTGEGEATATKVVGTYGYLAPEYLSDGLATTKSDVYAFGVVLFEIISGKEAIIRTEGAVTKNPERRSLASTMLAALRNSPDSMSMSSLKDLIDPNMMDLYPHDCVFKLAMLAKQCVDEDPILRPDMKQVVISLSQIVLSSIEWEATLAGNSQVFSGLVQGR